MADTDSPGRGDANTWWTGAGGRYRLGALLATQLAPPQLAEVPILYTRAEAGHTDAQYRLGQLASGLDPPQLAEARTWWTRAAKGGHADAQYNLGLLLATRLDPPEVAEARTWWSRAAEAGSIDAQINLGVLLASQLDPPDLVEARTWWTRAAEAGSTEAHHVPVVLVWQLDSRPEFLPAGDHRVIEGLAHAGEALGGVDARVDLLDDRRGLGEDAL